MRTRPIILFSVALLCVTAACAQTDRQVLDQMEEEFVRKHESFLKKATLLAALYEEKGDLDSAAKLYEKLVTLRPEDSRIREKLAHIYGRQGRDDALLAMYSRLREMLPEDRTVMLGLAQALFDADRKDDALAVIAEALEDAGNDTGIVLEIAQTLIRKKMDDQAAVVLEKGLAQHPGDLLLLHPLARVRLRTGDYAGAIEAAQTLALKGRMGIYREQAALLLARALREGEGADEYFRKNDSAIASLETDYAKALLELGDALARAGQDEKAVATWRRVIARLPDVPQAADAADRLKNR